MATEYVIDGSRITSLETIYVEISRAVQRPRNANQQIGVLGQIVKPLHFCQLWTFSEPNIMSRCQKSLIDFSSFRCFQFATLPQPAALQPIEPFAVFDLQILRSMPA
jgi:hypothetical protein